MQKIKILLICLVVLASACTGVRAPGKSVPKRHGVATEAFGGWIMVSSGNPEVSGGELIGLTEESVYIMTGDGLQVIPRAEVVSARLIMYNTDAWEYSLWTTAGSLATLSNGFFLAFTFPMWLVTGIPVATGEANRHNYIDYPAAGWDELNKFARFPQGIPKGIDISSLRPRH
jgi:hypothetical protein